MYYKQPLAPPQLTTHPLPPHPLSSLLTLSLLSQVKEAAVKCLLCVVRKVNVTDTSVFLSVFDNVSSMIFPSEKTNFSDELIHLALQVGLVILTPGMLFQLC